MKSGPYLLSLSSKRGLTRVLLLPCVLGALFMMASKLNANTSVYESFSYRLSQSVIGANGGSGWGTNSAWEITSGTNTNAVNFLSNSMTYRDTTAAANALVVSGGRVATALGDVGIWRDLSSVVSNKTFFISFLIRSSNTASANSYGGLDPAPEN